MNFTRCYAKIIDDDAIHKFFEIKPPSIFSFFKFQFRQNERQITSNIKLAKKIKKLGTHQETVLAGVAEHLTEEEKSNINLTISKMDQLSNNINVEDTPSHRNTTEKPNFEAFFTLFKHELRSYGESDKMDSLMFSTVEYLRFKMDLNNSFNPMYYQGDITELIIFENQANRVLLFFAS